MKSKTYLLTQKKNVQNGSEIFTNKRYNVMVNTLLTELSFCTVMERQ